MLSRMLISNIIYDITSRDFHIIASRAAYSVLTNPIIRLPSQTPSSLSYCRSSPQLSPTSSAVQPGHLSCNTLYLQPHKTYFTHTTASVGINVILITYLVTPITLITNNIVPYPAWQRWQDSEGKR